MNIRFISFVVAMAAVAACSSASGPSLDPNRSNCDTVCGKASDCLGTNASSCSDNCTTKSDNDSSYKSSVAACADCVHDKTCPDVSSCSDNCLSAVVQ
jgi:hypothetical protein